MFFQFLVWRFCATLFCAPHVQGFFPAILHDSHIGCTWENCCSSGAISNFQPENDSFSEESSDSSDDAQQSDSEENDLEAEKEAATATPIHTTKSLQPLADNAQRNANFFSNNMLSCCVKSSFVWYIKLQINNTSPLHYWLSLSSYLHKVGSHARHGIFTYPAILYHLQGLDKTTTFTMVILNILQLLGKTRTFTCFTMVMSKAYCVDFDTDVHTFSKVLMSDLWKILNTLVKKLKIG